MSEPMTPAEAERVAAALEALAKQVRTYPPTFVTLLDNRHHWQLVIEDPERPPPFTPAGDPSTWSIDIQWGAK